MAVHKKHLQRFIMGEDAREDENFYDAEYLQESVDDDRISPAEEGFMIGYLAA